MLVDPATNTAYSTLQLSSSQNPATVTLQFTPMAKKLWVMGGSISIGSTDITVDGYYTYTTTPTPRTVVTTVCREDEYRYGYNAQIKVNEWSGVGNHTTALYWEYDTRTGVGGRSNLEIGYHQDVVGRLRPTGRIPATSLTADGFYGQRGTPTAAKTGAILLLN